MPRPLIGLMASVKSVEGEHMEWHAVPDSYVRAVQQAAGAVPVLLPALGDDDVIARLDGLLLTGDISNIAPDHYGGGLSCPPHDPRRDATAFALIRRAIATGVPLLAICRGFQELNVALGGSLTPQVHAEPGRLDHRSDHDQPAEVQYGTLAHAVTPAPGGVLAGLAGPAAVQVNSLHGQGIARLAPGLTIEATAPDGLIEAVRVTDAPAFALGVQWHPEWGWQDHGLNRALWSAFGAAARQRAARHAPYA